MEVLVIALIVAGLVVMALLFEVVLFVVYGVWVGRYFASEIGRLFRRRQREDAGKS